MKRDGIEPLAATLLIMATGLQPATGNTLQLIVNTLSAMRSALASKASGRECVY